MKAQEAFEKTNDAIEAVDIRGLVWIIDKKIEDAIADGRYKIIIKNMFGIPITSGQLSKLIKHYKELGYVLKKEIVPGHITIDYLIHLSWNKEEEI